MTEYDLFILRNEDYIKRLSVLTESNDYITDELYDKYDVKRGLRDKQGSGVVCGLTEISEMNGFESNEEGFFKLDKNGDKIPCKGTLFYRGIEVKTLIKGLNKEDRFGFEETCYLLLFGHQPTSNELEKFNKLIEGFRHLPSNFVRDIIMKAPSASLLNMMSRGVLTLYSYDKNPDDLALENILKQSLELLAQLPLISVYGYNAYLFSKEKCSLHIHQPVKGYSTAENILHLLRPDRKFTRLEARLLDICLILHAEHGGGNNSTFTTHVISSSGTDTYSAISASLGSLKGGKHGGANIKVVKMMEDMKKYPHNTDEEISDYFEKVLEKKVFDQRGIIYGMGHAVYSISDPRTVILKKYAKKVAEEKGLQEEFDLYERVEKIAPKVISEKRKLYKPIPVNVDFYSGFVYQMLGIPQELFTPLFAVSRMAGWGAHRLEEIANNGKIIRPAYVSVAKRRPYLPLNERR